MMSVPRLSSRAEILMTAIMIAAARPTTTILRCVARFAVYSDEFMRRPNHCGHQRNIVFPDNAPIPTYNTRTRGNLFGRMYALGFPTLRAIGVIGEQPESISLRRTVTAFVEVAGHVAELRV